MCVRRVPKLAVPLAVFVEVFAERLCCHGRLILQLPPDMSLQPLVAQKRILVCVGSGGVGKTTTAASLGLAGARAGRRTLVLTIDPAKRLANALGLSTLGHDVQAVPPEKVALGGAPVAGIARRDDARPEARLRRDRRRATPRIRESQKRIFGQPHLPADLVDAGRVARVRGDGQAVRDRGREEVRPHHPRHAADGERARLPRRAGAADLGHRLAGDPVVHQALHGGGALLAQGGRHGRGVRA